MKHIFFILLAVLSSSRAFVNDFRLLKRCRTTRLSVAEEKETALPQNGVSSPSSFREAEILGLKLMQEGNYEAALKAFKNGMKLPGSRPDVIRTKLMSGPSPVGGSFGGLESNNVLQLDEFELQAAHYNMACAYAQLEDIDMAVANLKQSFENGFDNYATVRGDPDLKSLQGTQEFNDLMDQYDAKFNPFGFFSKK